MRLICELEEGDEAHWGPLVTRGWGGGSKMVTSQNVVNHVHLVMYVTLMQL